MNKIYFDYSSTTPICDEALETYMNTCRKFFANPSSVHSAGTEAKEFLEENRSITAKLLCCKAQDVFYTSGGTESCSIILSSLLRNTNKNGEIIFSSLEHEAISSFKPILEQNGYNVIELKCKNGYLSPDLLRDALTDTTKMVCILHTSNILGTMPDIENLVKVVREKESQTGRKIHFHSDCVQSIGKTPFNFTKLGIDSASFSSHKFQGPRGVGILLNKNRNIMSLASGGGQENGLRAGTENLAGIAAMNTALNKTINMYESNHERIREIRKQLENAALQNGFVLLSPSVSSNLPITEYILNISHKTLPAEVLVRIFSDKGFLISSGSACSKGSRAKTEKILDGAGVRNELKRGSIRISLSNLTTSKEADSLCRVFEEL